MNLLVFGLGYTARAVVARERAGLGRVVGTVRRPDAATTPEDVVLRAFGPDASDPRLPADIAESDLVLVSVPPGDSGDPVLRAYGEAIAAGPARWIGYLSTIGVYGDHGGAWIDEATPVAPGSPRTRRRVEAEGGWLDLGARTGKAVAVFRLAGIYGPGRNPFVKLEEGRSQRIVKPGQVFNRIHVADIAAVVAASIARPRRSAIYNVADTEPAPPQDVIAHAADLAGVPPPPEVAFADAALSPMARAFYGENKRVRARLLADELGVALAYPTYREGLAALRGEAD